MQHVFTLFVLALLQLCRAEIPKALPVWYAANLINDAGYQLKPLTEIFETQPTSKNPIVTSTSSTTEAKEMLAISPASTTRTTELESSPSSEDTTKRVIPLRESSSTSAEPIREQRQIYQLQPLQFLPPLPSLPIPTSQQQASPQTTGLPKYFLLYQQAPVSIQQYPQSASPSISNPQPPSQTTRQVTAQETTPKLAQQTNEFTQEETPSTRISTTQTTILPSSAFTDVPKNILARQGPFINSTPTLVPLVGTWQDPITPSRPAHSSPAISSTTPSSSTMLPYANINFTERNPRPNITTVPRPKQSGNTMSALTIRVKAPRGSITNIKINPTTTTRKPSSRRSQRRKGNNYNNCVDSCRGKKEPICAAPLAVIPIDSNSLKGFPSICHLACHNSFRKNQPFEKIMDGRCSKLRTRIRTFDKNKLNREEMNKAQYTILSNSPETVVQVIQNDRSG
ncbi:unnamed protein product [Parnassius mnemosyne]|uniref:Kazal-like domain-containing protein n=1 Tax=Parnassius mnemosyne TaxID=213953 RepID=A0AAV1KS06_9NEOP